jgi:hypothetical protein
MHNTLPQPMCEAMRRDIDQNGYLGSIMAFSRAKLE